MNCMKLTILGMVSVSLRKPANINGCHRALPCIEVSVASVLSLATICWLLCAMESLPCIFKVKGIYEQQYTSLPSLL